MKCRLATLTVALFLATQGAQAQMPGVAPINIQHTLPASVRSQKMKSDARNTRDAGQNRPTYQDTDQSNPSTTPSKASQAPAIHRSAADGRADSVAEALDQEPRLLYQKDASGYTALHHAAVGGHLDVIEVLLDKGAKLDAIGSRGETALYLAASKGNYEVVKLLSEHGANVDRASSDGKTPLHRAAMAGDSDTVTVLLDAGADASLKDRSGKTALEMAQRYRQGDSERVIRSLEKAAGS